MLLSIAVRLMDKGFGPMTQVYLRLALGSILSFCVLHKNLRWKVIRTTPQRDWLILFLMGSIGYSIGVYFISLGALYTTLLNVSIIYATFPFFVYLYSYFVLRKQLSPKLVLFLLISFYGVAVVSTKSFFPHLNSFGVGELYVLLSAATMSWYYVGRKMLTSHLNNSEVTVLVMPIAFIVSFVLAMGMGEKFNIHGFSDPFILLGLCIGAGFNLVSSFLNNYSFSHLDAVVGSQLLLTENFFSPLLGFFLYAEKVGFVEAVGVFIIFISVFATNRYANS